MITANFQVLQTSANFYHKCSLFFPAYILVGKKQESAEDKMEEEGGDKPVPHQEVTLGNLGLLCLTTEVSTITTK